MCDEETKTIIKLFSRCPVIQNNQHGNSRIGWEVDNDVRNRMEQLITKFPQKTRGDWESHFYEEWQHKNNQEAETFLTVYFKHCAVLAANNVHRFLKGFNNVPKVDTWINQCELFRTGVNYICNIQGNTLNQFNSSRLSLEFKIKLRKGYNYRTNQSNQPLRSYVIGMLGSSIRRSGVLYDRIKSEIRQSNTTSGEHPIIYYVWYSDWRLLRDCPQKKGVEEALRRYLSPSEFEQFSQARKIFKEHYATDLNAPTGSPLREPTHQELQAMVERYQQIFEVRNIETSEFLSWLTEIISTLRRFYGDISRGITPPPTQENRQLEEQENINDLGNLIFQSNLLSEIEQKSEILMYLNFGFGYSQEKLGLIINRHKSNISRQIKSGLDQLNLRLINLLAHRLQRQTGSPPGLYNIEAERKKVNLEKNLLKKSLKIAYSQSVYQYYLSYSMDCDSFISEIIDYIDKRLRNFPDYQPLVFQENLDFLSSKINSIIQNQSD